MQVMLWTSQHHADLFGKTGEISSRIGIADPADIFSAETDLFAAVEKRRSLGPLNAIFIDEAQFLTDAQVWQVARIADRQDVPVLAYGLRTDFRGNLFPGAATLLAIADDLREVRTICHCGRKATMTARLDQTGHALTEGDQVSVEKQAYVSLCRRHWEEEMGRWPDPQEPKSA